ncbi:MAG: RnfABCDGE type electron transport complex subunit D [Firmicutes bacterium]|nr:RnfABCDGE type electron transport complex subunit D [Bacillota bacterium]
MDDKLIVSVSPHIRVKDTTRSIMRDVLIALVPALIAAVIFFGFRSLLLCAVCMASCIFFEWAFEKVCKKPNTIGDLTAAVTGMILAFNLPSTIALWQAIFGCLVAIVVVKQLFGGLGYNFANPAATARVVMLIAFSGSMTTWTAPNFVDGVSTSTPLVSLKEGALDPSISMLQLFVGGVGGSLGEISSLAILIGGIYLLVRKVITWHTPVAFIGTAFVLSLAKGGFDFALAQILAGSIFLGAFFMATDYVTTPSTKWGRIIFGVGCGLITCLIRFYGNYPEGVSFAILFMNILTPYISKWTATKPLGGVKA